MTDVDQAIADELEAADVDGAPDDEAPGDEEAADDDADLEADDGEAEDAEGDEAEAGSPEAAIESERALQARDGKLDRENERHAKRVAEIMDAAAEYLIPCPVCMDGIAGWIYPPDVQALPDEAIARVRSVIGLPDLTTFAQDPNTEPCPVCHGRGQTKTGGNVPGYETRTCARCQKMGYIVTGQASPVAVAAATIAEVVTGPTTIEADENDPEVLHLRERGFTVIPPIPVAGNG